MNTCEATKYQSKEEALRDHAEYYDAIYCEQCQAWHLIEQKF
jgi:hypothetical protein